MDPELAPTIQVLYSCHACGLFKVSVSVRARTEIDDIGDWVKEVMAVAVAIDHKRRSPRCSLGHADLFIPLFDGSPAGSPRRH